MTRRRTPRPVEVPDEPKFRLRDPIDVLAAIPYLVGYHPANSMVLLGMRGRQLIFTARYDLPGPDTPRTEVRETIGQALEVLSRQSLTGVLLVGYGPANRVGPFALTLQSACGQVRLDVLEVLRAENGRYWSYLCTDPTCCPPEGTPYRPEASTVAAEWTVAGRVVLPDRETYEKQLKPVTGAARAAIEEATERAGDRLTALITRPFDEDAAQTAVLAEGRRALDAGLSRLRRGERLTDDEVAWLSVVVASSDVRRVALSRIRGAGAELILHRGLWMDVLRRAERDLTPTPGCLFAFAAWRCGEGALARLALERTLRIDPYDDLAAAMYHMLCQGMPPATFDDAPPQVRRRSARRLRKRSSSRRAGSRRG